jgi:hypothetical protein
MNQVYLFGHPLELQKSRSRKTGGCYFKIDTGAVGTVPVGMNRAGLWVCREGENVYANTQLVGATGNLGDDLLYPAHRVWNKRSVEMKDSHFSLWLKPALPPVSHTLLLTGQEQGGR